MGNEQTKVGSGVRHGTTGALTALVYTFLTGHGVSDELAIPAVTLVSAAVGSGIRWLMGKLGG